MEILEYIVENRLILIPVLYVLAEFIKKTGFIKNKYLPVILLPISVVFSILMGGDTIVNEVIQGVLVAGATVLGNQVVKQLQKEE